jgi:copper chaperone CopZ
MKTKSLFIALLTLVTVTLFAKDAKVTLNVPMHCESCQKKIEKSIALEKGVKNLAVDLKKKTVALTYDDTKTNPEKLIAGFKKIGYVASVNNGAATAQKACCSEKAGEKKECADNKACADKKEGCADKKACADKKEGCATTGDKKCTTAAGEKKEGCCQKKS